MGDDTLGIGIVGCGGFALFACEQFAQVPGVKVAAVTDVVREAACAAAEQFGVAGPVEEDELVSSPDVDVVYIATPPFLHYPQAMKALEAGKHVISEKPLAVTVAQADEMVATANDRGLLLIANLMQRYNPLFDAVGTLIESKVLGEPLHGYFENYASDEQLSAEHWFWDPAKSGGIFIEHGVHFFDLFAGWLGPGEVVAAQAGRRPGSGIEEQVHCTVRYDDGVLVNFYHAFTQPGRLDRQEIRIVFERGDVSLYEWVPTRLKLHAITDEHGTNKLLELFPGAQLHVAERYDAADQACQARHKSFEVTQKIEMTYGEDHDKMQVYADILRGMITDQWAWIRDRSHTRRITEQNGRDSVVMAVRATELARGGA